MSPDLIDMMLGIFVAMLRAGTPLVFAALGELVTEKSGVLNLGVEGMMLMGAVAAIAVALTSGSLVLGLMGGMITGMIMALVFAFLTLTLRATQVATGLALTLFGIGLSAFVGLPYQDVKLDAPLTAITIPGISDIPILGPLLFGHDPFVYLSLLVFVGVRWFLYKTRWGLILRAVGESAESADAIGYPVIAIRYLATLFGGAMAGLAGAHLTLSYTPMWAEDMTAGRGWIALALVVFASWRPGWVLIGAYLFGGVMALQLHLQARGISIPAHFLSMAPYVATIIVLVLMSRDSTRIKLNAPAALGKPFHRT